MQRFLTHLFLGVGLLVALVTVPMPLLAHDGEVHTDTDVSHTETIDEVLEVDQPVDAEAATRLLSFQTVGIAGAIIVVLIFIGLFVPPKSDILKHLVYWPIVVTVVVSTILLGYVTVSLNLKSWSKGPIHWHADFEVWACGQELELVDPKGLSNKVGSPSRHEHNDKRLHYEGVVMEPTDASVTSFFALMGGTLSSNRLTFPTNNGMVHYANGDSCAESQSGGVVSMFVYSVNPDDTFSQRKIADPSTYIMRDESQVPPGDCIIIEFGEAKDKTDKLCRSYRVAQEIGKLLPEVPYGN